MNFGRIDDFRRILSQFSHSLFVLRECAPLLEQVRGSLNTETGPRPRGVLVSNAGVGVVSERSAGSQTDVASSECCSRGSVVGDPARYFTRAMRIVTSFIESNWKMLFYLVRH